MLAMHLSADHDRRRFSAQHFPAAGDFHLLETIGTQAIEAYLVLPWADGLDDLLFQLLTSCFPQPALQSVFSGLYPGASDLCKGDKKNLPRRAPRITKGELSLALSFFAFLLSAPL
jgi:hypothetical protein